MALAGLIGGARALLWSGTPVVEVDADWFRCVEELTPLPSRHGPGVGLGIGGGVEGSRREPGQLLQLRAATPSFFTPSSPRPLPQRPPPRAAGRGVQQVPDGGPGPRRGRRGGWKGGSWDGPRRSKRRPPARPPRRGRGLTGRPRPRARRKRLYNTEEKKYTVAYVHKAANCAGCATARPQFEQVARAGEGLWESVAIDGPLHNDFLEFADLADLARETESHVALPYPQIVLFVSKGKKYKKFVFGEDKLRVKKGSNKGHANLLNLASIDMTKFIMKHISDRAIENNPINQAELDEFQKDPESWFQMRDARLNKEEKKRDDKQRKKRREEAKKEQDAARRKAKKEASRKAGLFKHSEAVVEFDEKSWMAHPMKYMDHLYKPTMVFMYKAKDEASRNISSTYQTLAAKYKGKAVLGTINCDYHREICKDSEGEDAPIPSFIRHVPDFEEEGGISYAAYGGNHTLEELDADIHTMLNVFHFYPEVHQLTNMTVWEEHCIGHKDLCYIAFLPDLSGSSVELRNAYITEMEDAAEEAGLPHRRGYFWSEAGAQPDLEDAFAVASHGYPSLFALSTKKHGFAKYEGAFEVSGFVAFFTKLMKTQIRPMDRSNISIDNILPWNGKMPEVLEDEFSLDDIMGSD